MIFINIGLPGSGKTLDLTAQLIKNFKLGKDIFTNYFINTKALKIPRFRTVGNFYYFEDIESFKHMENGIVGIDEVQQYFNSREWSKLQKHDQLKFQQHRKDGIDIIGTVQHPDRVDTVIREISNYYIEFHKLSFKYFLPKIKQHKPFKYNFDKYEKIFFFTKKFYLPDEWYKVDCRNHGFSIFFLNKKISSLYSTKQKIANFEMNLKIDTMEKAIQNYQISF